MSVDNQRVPVFHYLAVSALSFFQTALVKTKIDEKLYRFQSAVYLPLDTLIYDSSDPGVSLLKEKG